VLEVGNIFHEIHFKGENFSLHHFRLISNQKLKVGSYQMLVTVLTEASLLVVKLSVA
jgi:hypothetical protein